MGMRCAGHLIPLGPLCGVGGLVFMSDSCSVLILLKIRLGATPWPSHEHHFASV